MDSERIYLKKITPEDFTPAVIEWFKDPELMKYYTNSGSAISLENILESIRSGEETGTAFTYGIFLKETNEMIGTVKIGTIIKSHAISDLATLIGNKNYQGKGLACEAVRLGTTLAFENYKIRKLFSGMYASNISAVKTYVKAGWVVEGSLKGHYQVDGRNEDRVLVGCFNPAFFTEDEIAAAHAAQPSKGAGSGLSPL